MIETDNNTLWEVVYDVGRTETDLLGMKEKNVLNLFTLIYLCTDLL